MVHSRLVVVVVMVVVMVVVVVAMLSATANLCKKTVRSAHNYRLNDCEYCEKERDANEVLKPVKPFTILMHSSTS